MMTHEAAAILPLALGMSATSNAVFWHLVDLINATSECFDADSSACLFNASLPWHFEFSKPSSAMLNILLCCLPVRHDSFHRPTKNLGILASSTTESM